MNRTRNRLTDEENRNAFRIGHLVRTDDVTGLSGTGYVAWLVQFPDGKCVVRWCVSDVRQTAIFDSLADVLAVHGHDGRTKAQWKEANDG